MCNRISYFLSGKHKPTYKRNEAGKVTDEFIIVNGNNMYLTGRKIDYKVLTYHTGYVGNLR
jgi:large subunit ribosomal protein L13